MAASTINNSQTSAVSRKCARPRSWWVVMVIVIDDDDDYGYCHDGDDYTLLAQTLLTQ